MKKKILAVTAAFLITLTTTFAQDTTPVPTAIVKELYQEFTDAGNVQWKTTGNFYKASFISNAQPLGAFFFI
jgi:hypothetical protein